MYEYTCAHCGKVVKVKCKFQVQRFCNKSCAVSYRNKLRLGPKGESCIYEPVGVICERQVCSKCGWNPEVAQARLERIIGGTNG